MKMVCRECYSKLISECPATFRHGFFDFLASAFLGLDFGVALLSELVVLAKDVLILLDFDSDVIEEGFFMLFSILVELLVHLLDVLICL